MKSRFLPLIALSCTALPSCGGKGDVKEAVLQRPNILLIVADDQSYPHAGAYGCPWVKTPGFDSIAAEGILFENCYTPNAKSAPSRATLLTGRYSWQLEDLGNHIPVWPDGKYKTFFEALSENGYHVGFTGKGWAPGNPGRNVDGDVRELTGTPYQSREVENPPTQCLGKWDYEKNFEDFLSDADGRPWLFWMGIREPHRPYEYGTGVSLGGKKEEDIDSVPSYWPDDSTVRNDMLDYAFEIEYYDAQIVRTLDYLRDKGMLDNTLVIITADNGMPFPRRKGNSFECSTHLPLAVMWPSGVRNPGRTSSEYISMVDFAPTILSLAGVDPERSGMAPVSGKSFTDILSDRSEGGRDVLLFGRERHDAARPENQGYPIRGILEDGFLYLHNLKPWLYPAGNPEIGYRDADSSPTKTDILHRRRFQGDSLYWKINFGLREEEELYDLSTDPECMRNLSLDPASKKRMKALRRRMEKALKKGGDPRMGDNGDIFDTYPYYQQNKFDNYYERWFSGKIDKKKEKTFNLDDYEKE